MFTKKVNFFILFFCFFSCNHNENKDFLIIGDTIWSKKNLNTTIYSNGDSILHLHNDKEWSNTSVGAFCYYGTKVITKSNYGVLYNWYAVNDLRGLCPKGWRIANEKDWQKLIQHFGGENIAGQKIKKNKHGENLNAVAGGNRKANGFFNGEGNSAPFWSADHIDEKQAVAFYVNWSHDRAGKKIGNKNNGLYCRCVKDI